MEERPLNFRLKVKIYSLDKLDETIKKLKEIKTANPNTSIDVEVDCQKNYDTDFGCKYTDRPDN